MRELKVQIGNPGLLRFSAPLEEEESDRPC
jgi:hypothetical protein